MERSEESLERLEAQLTLIRWQLDAVQTDGGDANRQHLERARLAFEHALELLPRIALLGSRRVRLLSELSKLRDRLLTLQEKAKS